MGRIPKANETRFSIWCEDVLLDTNYDASVQNGDFAIGESTRQHQQLLLVTQPGEWKQNPTIGIGIENFLLDDGNLSRDLTAEVRRQFEDDGMTVNKIAFDGQKLTIEALYE